MPTIYIEGKPHEVKGGQNMLQAVLSLGYDLEYFCWHPALGSVGACRQCAVIQYKDEEAEKEGRGQLTMACMTPADDGTRISIKALKAVEFRKSVIEWLMVNHPHDCPVCDEGGECHLQDMTVMSGHNYREFRFKKRTHHNQYLGPFINHEMNRCIACYRCVRYYREFAGGDDLDVFAAHDDVYFGRHEEGILQSEFSGNLVEVCPTGVFTDRTLKQHYARKWDLQSAPSVCQHCGVGCNTLAGTRYDRMVRTLNRYNRQVNGYFLCDRGRFGYEFVNSKDRIVSSRHGQREISRDRAIEAVAEIIGDGSNVIGIGSPRASIEANFALRKLTGKNRFSSGLNKSRQDQIDSVISMLKNGPARSASLYDVERADAVLVLGEDLTNTAPMMALAVRQASRTEPARKAVRAQIPLWNDHGVREFIQDEVGPVYILTPVATKLDGAARQTYRAGPDEIARFGFAVAHELNDSAPGVDELSNEAAALVKEVAGALREAERPVIISGTSLNNRNLIEAAANVAWALSNEQRRAGIALTVPEVNSLGCGLIGGMALESAIEMVMQGTVDTIVVLENDLYRRAGREKIDALFEKCRNVVVLDHLANDTTARADILIPAATFVDGDGTVINYEGRAQRYFQALNPERVPAESWRTLRDIMLRNGREDVKEWKGLDAVSRAAFTGIDTIGVEIHPAPAADYRVAGLRIPRSPHRFSGRTAMNANESVSEPKPPHDPDSPLSFSQEGFLENPPDPALIPFFWSPGWNSVQATAKYQQETGGPLRGGDPGVRLFEPSGNDVVRFFTDIPPPPGESQDRYLVIPLHHCFGSDETSARGASIRQLVPEPYIGLNAGGAKRAGVEPGTAVQMTVGGISLELPVRIIDGLPNRIVGLPVGLPGLCGIELPEWGALNTEGQA